MTLDIPGQSQLQQKISDVEAAQAMGHDISTHKKHYQRWISSEAKRSQVMSTITF